MAGEVTFRPPRIEDAYELEAGLRAADRAELEATSARPIREQIEQGIALSWCPGVALGRDGELLCIFGAVPLDLMGDAAAPWCLGTDDLIRYPQALTKSGERYFTQVQQLYPQLVNYVDARNTFAIRWLRRMGFSLDAPAAFGHKGYPFHRFHRSLDHVQS